MASELPESPVEIAEFLPGDVEESPLDSELDVRVPLPPNAGIPPVKAPGKPFLVAFFDRFLQEQNIKWILVFGVLILLASSIKLVGTLWNDSSVAWKHLILLAYTAGFYGLSQGAYWRVGLRKTGTVLMALTVLLVPITCVGLHWVFADWSGGFLTILRNVSLALGTAALGWFASRRIFTHFLRAPQPTFVACYLALSVAGAVLPGLSSGWWPVTTLILWSVFTIGSVKVNRHIFWMAEEYRLPRIFGFFPIALLGAQFVGLFAWQVGPAIPRDWLGLVLVMTAIPVLLTADAVARVFQDRTGHLVRPLPWSIVMPIIVALGLCAGGISLALTGLPLPSALTPTALLTALALGTVAYRTGHRGFVWGALACLALAYNFAYVFCLDAVRYLLQTGAAAVREQRLPFAFYGLTYLPLIGSLIAAATVLSRTRNAMPFVSRFRELWVGPLQQFSASLCGILLVAAFTHSKALLPVAGVLCAAFFLQALLFRKPELVLATIAAWLAATAGVAPFLRTVLEWPAGFDFSIYVWSASAVALLVPGTFVDRWIARIRQEVVPGTSTTGAASDGPPVPFGWCRIASLGISFLLAAICLEHPIIAGASAPSFSTGICATLLLMIHALIVARSELGIVALGYAAAFAAVQALVMRIPPETLMERLEMGLLGLWVAAHGMGRFPRTRVTRTFGEPSRWLSLAGLTPIAAFYVLTLLASLVFPSMSPSWLAAGAILLWTVDASRHTGNGLWAGLGSLLLFALTGAIWMGTVPAEVGGRWLCVMWSALGLILVPILSPLSRRTRFVRAGDGAERDVMAEQLFAVVRPLELIVMAILSVIACGSLLWLTVPMRMAGSVAAGAWLLHGTLSGKVGTWRTALVLGNWQLLCLVLWWCVPEATFLMGLSRPQIHAAALPLAAAAMCSVLVLRRLPSISGEPGSDDLLHRHAGALQSLAAGGLLWKLAFVVGPLTPLELILSFVAISSFIGNAVQNALERRDERCVWWSEVLAAFALFFYWRCGVIEFGHGFAMYIFLAAGIVLWSIGHSANRLPGWQVLARPFQQTGFVLPLATVGVALVRAVQGEEPLWLGANSLALLLAAGFYFWRGIEGRDRRLVIVATAIVNVALGLLWRELSFSDPQFFMIPAGLSIIAIVELLRPEIPRRFHDPLRYVGALTILVSPTFHIVEGSWLHLVSLMIAAVVICLLAMGLQVRALMYTGSAFLIADLVAMLIRGGIDRPNLLWIAGIALGTLVIVLGAICEKHREDVLQRLRILSSRLESWN